MGKRVTPPKSVTSPTWGHPVPCKQALIKHTFMNRSVTAEMHQNGTSALHQIHVRRNFLSAKQAADVLR